MKNYLQRGSLIFVLLSLFLKFFKQLKYYLFISYLNEWQYIEFSFNTFSRFRQYERMFLMFWCCFVFIFGDRMLVMSIVCYDKNYCYLFSLSKGNSKKTEWGHQLLQKLEGLQERIWSRKRRILVGYIYIYIYI